MVAWTVGCEPTLLLERHSGRRRNLARTKRFDDLAIRDGAVAAGADHAAEFGAERGEVADLAVDLGQLGVTTRK